MSSQSSKTNQIFHTNSVIRMQILPQVQNHPYAIQWFSQPNPMFNHNYILTRFDVNRTGRNTQFQCTPLDYGSSIVGRLLVPKDSHPAVFMEEKYGPITVEKQIIQQFDCQQIMDAKIILNKSITLKGRIKIAGPEKGSPAHQKANIILQAPNFKFDIRIDQNIRLPSNNSFFKFYDKEEDCLGISVYHQHSELVEIMKDDKNVQLFGFYIKISFKTRIERDIFLFRLIMKFGITVEELQPPNMDKFTINIKPNEKSTNQRVGSLKAQPTEEKPFKKQSKIKQLDDQIQKLLGDNSDADCQYSLDMADAELLLLSTNNLVLTQKKSMKASDFQKYGLKTPFLKEINENTPENKAKDQSAMNYEQDLSVNSKSNHSNNLQTPDQNYFRNIILKLTNQLKMLRKENRRLAHQNKKLKDENMRLRFKQIKNTSNSRVYPCKNNQQTEKVNLTKERISMTPFIHHKRQSIYQLNTENRHCTTKSNYTQDNFHEVMIKERPKANIPLASSSGSILIASRLIKNTDRTEKGHHPYLQTFNSSSVKDLSKQSQIPEEKQFPQKLKYHKSQQLMRRMIPEESKKLEGGLHSFVKTSLNPKPPNFGNSSVQFINSTIFSGK